jgi:hypothetical protein
MSKTYFTSVALASAAVIAAVVSSPATALQTGDNDGREPVSRKQAERVMRDFAKCVVSNKSREAKAVAFLRLPDGDLKQSASGSEIASSGCAPRGSQMRFQPELFSRSIYTALYRKYYLKSAPTDFSGMADADYRTEYQVGDTPVSTEQLALRTFSDCTVRQNPVAAHLFAISEMQSDAEKTAVPTVTTSMQQCLNAGATLKFSRTILKGLIAESLYKFRRRMAVPVATTVK